MSVVNQMLKDLEKHNTPTALQLDDDASVNVPNAQSPVKWIFIVVLLLLMFVAYGVHLKGGMSALFSSENESKTEQVVDEMDSNQTSQSNITDDSLLNAADPIASENSNAKAVKINKESLDNETQKTSGNHQASELTPAITTHPIDEENESTRKAHNIQQVVLADQAPFNKDNNNVVDNRDSKSPETSGQDNQLSSAISKTTSQPIKKSPTSGNQERQTNSHSSNDVVVKQTSQQQTRDDRLRSAENDLDKGLHSSAERKLIAILEQYPDYHTARELLAYSYMQTKNNIQLVEFLNRSINEFPQYSTYRELLARHYISQKNWQQVITVAEGMSTTSESLSIMKAIAHQQRQEHAEAVAVYGELLRTSSDRGDWWLGLSISLEALQRHSDAYRALEKARNDPRMNETQRQYIQQKLSILKGRN